MVGRINRKLEMDRKTAKNNVGYFPLVVNMFFNGSLA